MEGTLETVRFKANKGAFDPQEARDLEQLQAVGLLLNNDFSLVYLMTLA